MPNLTLITLTPPSLPVGYCPLNYQTLANDIISGTQATFNSSIGNSFFNFGSSTPALNNQVYPWLDEDGNWWVFNGGYWNRKHPVSITSSERRIFIGTTNDLLSYDGGDGTSNPPTNYTGAMWEVDTNFQARFPVGAGTFAASGVVTVGGTTTSTAVAGEDKHTLTIPEMPSHTHSFFPLVTADANNGGANGVQYGTTASVATTSTGGDAAHNNLPPFYGVYFIKRTARVYYTK
jgi:hypothetical protein